MARSLRHLSVAGALFVCGCSLPADGFRTDGHAQASGPCWEVDIGNGLDPDSATEIQSLFACIDRDGTVRPLAPFVARLETPDRQGVEIGARLAQAMNALASTDLDVWALAGTAADLLSSEAPALEPLMAVSVELLYGRPWGAILTDVQLADPAELEQGLISVVLPLASPTATIVIDDASDVPALLAAGATDPAFADALCTLAGIADSEDPEVRSLADRLMGDLGGALQQSRTPANDRWPRASGDSARDFVTTLLLAENESGDPFLDAAHAPLATILHDSSLRSRVETAISDAIEGDRLSALPLQLRHLAETSIDGGPVRPGEDSALLAFLRLLHDANQPMECSLDLGLTTLDVDLGNLSVTVLRTLSRADPSATRSGVNLLGTVLGWELSQGTLELIATTGVCPVLDEQLVSDLQSVDRLNDPETGDLLIVTLDLVSAFDHGSDDSDRVPELVDVLSQIHGTGLTPPLEELLRDVGDSALLADAMAAIPLVLDPAPLDVAACPTGSARSTSQGLGTREGRLVGDSQPAVLESLEPILELWIQQEDTWTAVGNLSMLLSEDGARIRDAPRALARFLEADPELLMVQGLAPLLRNSDVSSPLLHLVESPVLGEEMTRTSIDQEGPLPFYARLVTDGTLDTVLRTIDLIIGWLDSDAGVSEEFPNE